jgi:hypothetical protein
MSHGKVLIGNWAEELAYEQDRREVAAAAKAQGGTLVQQIVRKVKAHNAPVQIAPVAADGFLHLGTVVMLQCAGTEGFLSTDLDDRSVIGTQQKVAVTTSKSAAPRLRSAFVIEADGATTDDVVRYGQRIRFRTLPELSDAGEVWYLASTMKTPLCYSKVTRNNETFLVRPSATGAALSVWQFAYAHPEYRPEMEGMPVKANAVVIVHNICTNSPLASTPGDTFTNDFGVECEVCCHRYTVKHVRGGNAPEQPSNLWAVVTAPTADA